MGAAANAALVTYFRLGLWVWVLRIVGTRADGVLGRLLLVATTGPQTTPAR